MDQHQDKEEDGPKLFDLSVQNELKNIGILMDGQSFGSCLIYSHFFGWFVLLSQSILL